MKTSLSASALRKYLGKQVCSLIPDGLFRPKMVSLRDVEAALDKCEHCFSRIRNPSFSDDEGHAFFSHVHADQYATFLVYLSSHIWKTRQDKLVCDRIMYLNRVLHSFMMSYKAKVPDVFWLAHPVGSVIGNADYSDYLYISQNCTINTGDADVDGSPRPKIGKYFTMAVGSTVIGNEEIGSRCSVGANVLLYKKRLKDDTIVINDNGLIRYIVQEDQQSFAQRMFR